MASGVRTRRRALSRNWFSHSGVRAQFLQTPLLTSNLGERLPLLDEPVGRISDEVGDLRGREWLRVSSTSQPTVRHPQPGGDDMTWVWTVSPKFDEPLRWVALQLVELLA